MTATGDEHTVRSEHHIAAPPHTVYRAWLEPDLAQRSMAPGDQEVTRIEIDEPPGGHWRTWKAGDGVIAGGFDSELLELVPGQRLVFRWGFIGPQRRQRPSFNMLLTISPRADPPGTMLTLVHEGLAELAAAMPDVAAILVVAFWDLVAKPGL